MLLTYEVVIKLVLYLGVAILVDLICQAGHDTHDLVQRARADFPVEYQTPQGLSEVAMGNLVFHRLISSETIDQLMNTMTSLEDKVSQLVRNSKSGSSSGW